MKISSTSKTVILSHLVLLLLLSSSPTNAAKLYKWVDAQGRVSYQDKPPPRDAKILSAKTLKKDKPDSPEEVKLNTTPVDIYVTKNCPSCETIIEKLDETNVPYNVKNIEEHREIQNRIIQETNGISVPVLFINDELIKPTDLSNLQEVLQKSGHIITPDATQN